jgi:hypothetical protein
VSAGGFSGGKLSFKKMSAGVASVLCKKTPIFGSRRSKLDHLTVRSLRGVYPTSEFHVQRKRMVKRPGAVSLRTKYMSMSWAIDVIMTVFLCRWFAWQFQKPICFPAVKRGLIMAQSWDKSLKKALIWMGSMSGNHWWYLLRENHFTKEGRAEAVTWFKIWRFQTLALKAASSSASPG